MLYNKNNKFNYCLDVKKSNNPSCVLLKKGSIRSGWDFICSFNSEYEAFIYADINGLKEIKRDGNLKEYDIYYE